jgi:Predicted integral membrane protein
MVLARALERGMMARATGTSEAGDVFGPARRAVRELGDAARVGAMRAMAATTEVVMRAGASDVVRVRGRARRGANERNVVRCDPRLRGKFLAAMIPGDSAVESVITSGIFSTLNIYNTLIIGRLILTWFPNPPRQIMYPLATLCDPYLNLFRGIIPPLGGIDLSPIPRLHRAQRVPRHRGGVAVRVRRSHRAGARARKSGREASRASAQKRETR